MAKNTKQDVLRITTKYNEVESSQFTALERFLQFLQTYEYGEFSAVINTNRAKDQREILIKISDKEKIHLNSVGNGKT